MNLLALRIGRNNNYWTSFGQNKDSILSPSVNSISNNLIDRSPNPFQIFENTLFNYEMAAPVPSFGSVRSFFFYSNSYGIYFILPIFSIGTKFNSLGRHCKSADGALNPCGAHTESGAIRSLFSSRITLAKSFILPHNDIDYLLNLFIFRYNQKKSFSNTLDILQSQLSAQKTFRFSQNKNRIASAKIKMLGAPMGSPNVNLEAGGKSADGAFAPRPYNFQPSVTAPFGGQTATSWGSLNTSGLKGLWGHISGLKLVCNGRLNLNSALRVSNNNFIGNSGGITRSKSFSFQWGNIPNNSSTNLSDRKSVV